MAIASNSHSPVALVSSRSSTTKLPTFFIESIMSKTDPWSLISILRHTKWIQNDRLNLVLKKLLYYLSRFPLAVNVIPNHHLALVESVSKPKLPIKRAKLKFDTQRTLRPPLFCAFLEGSEKSIVLSKLSSRRLISRMGHGTV